MFKKVTAKQLAKFWLGIHPVLHKLLPFWKVLTYKDVAHKSPKWLSEQNGITFDPKNLKNLNQAYKTVLQETMEGVADHSPDNKITQDCVSRYEDDPTFTENFLIPPNKSLEGEIENFTSGWWKFINTGNKLLWKTFNTLVDPKLWDFYSLLATKNNEIQGEDINKHISKIIQWLQRQHKENCTLEDIEKFLTEAWKQEWISAPNFKKISRAKREAYIQQFLKLQERFFSKEKVEERNTFVNDNPTIKEAFMKFHAHLISHITTHFTSKAPTDVDKQVLMEICTYDEQTKQRIPNSSFVKAVMSNIGPKIMEAIKEWKIDIVNTFLQKSSPTVQTLLMKDPDKKHFLRLTSCPATTIVRNLFWNDSPFYDYIEEAMADFEQDPSVTVASAA